MYAGKTLLDYTNLFSTNDYKKNYKIIYKYLKDKYVKSRVWIKKKDETRSYLLEEIKHDLLSEKNKKAFKYWNYVEHLFRLASTVIGCVSILVFASLVCVPVGITSSPVGIKICAITAGIKKHKSIIKKNKKKHVKIVLLGKTKLNIMEVLISKSLIDSYTSHDEFASVNNGLRECNEMKEEVKNFSVIFYINMFDISRETYEKNCIETIVDNNEILRLNKKHIEEGLDDKNLREITIKYHSDQKNIDMN